MNKISNAAQNANKAIKKTNVMSRYTWLIEAGHGGMINGKYQTTTYWWKRAFFKNGILLNPSEHSLEWLEDKCDYKYYEGVGNRDIARRIMKGLEKLGISYYDVLQGEESDVSLATRVKRANDYNSIHGNCIYLSIHSNAFTKQSAEGFSVYTSPGFTNSDKIAPFIFKEIAIEFPTHIPRKDETDGDVDKEENFYVLRNTAMPAVLSENLFYTNWKEVQILGSEKGRQRIADAHIKAIIEIEKNGI